MHNLQKYIEIWEKLSHTGVMNDDLPFADFFFSFPLLLSSPHAHTHAQTHTFLSFPLFRATVPAIFMTTKHRRSQLIKPDDRILSSPRANESLMPAGYCDANLILPFYRWSWMVEISCADDSLTSINGRSWAHRAILTTTKDDTPCTSTKWHVPGGNGGGNMLSNFIGCR